MKVFKFGGASVKDSQGVSNVARILQLFPQDKILVVVSAMGKTTNALEKILNRYLTDQDYTQELLSLKNYHSNIINGLFPNPKAVTDSVEIVFHELEHKLRKEGNQDMIYDQVVSLGEVISTIIVNEYLILKGLRSQWLDARDYISTNNNYREGQVDWFKTKSDVQSINRIFQVKDIVLTQGFIGRSTEGFTTTLGRDGSDFSAAIFASCLDAESVTIWKDVPGVMNADPKRLSDVVTFEELPFREAAEMTYYGASVIHPKTIKPLANSGIPLYVKNFDNPALPGTKIHECKVNDLPPLIVFKDNQCLISCKVTDYTFITEEHLSMIFHAVSSLTMRINVMQNSAISFSFCIDFRETKVKALIQKLQEHFEVFYNTGLTLITVKNYDEKTFESYRKRAGVLLEQSSRSTLQVLIKP